MATTDINENTKDIGPPPQLNIVLLKSEDIGGNFVEWSSIESTLPIDILLVTAIPCEFKICYSYLKNSKRSWHDKLGIVDFGEFGSGKINAALVRCSGKGSGGVNSSVIVVTNAAKILNPKAVICVGCCGMANPKKAKLGDVVISTQLATYSNVKITAGGKKEWRGIKTHVSRNMSKLILSAKDGWKAPLKEPNNFREIDVHRDAVMLSGPELVNNRERRQELLELIPDAIGVEMEGEGLYQAAFDLEIEWLVIKGISDMADGSKGETGNWQPFASAMAASVVENMFEYRQVIKNWPHYKTTV